MANDLPTGPCLLDLSRLASRLPRASLTGIDRVERAYLRFLLSRKSPVWGLVPSRLGYLLLDRTGLLAFAELCQDTRQLLAPDFVSRVMHRNNPDRAAVESTIRASSIDRVPRWNLQRLIARHLTEQGWYLNTGHSNLTGHMLTTCKSAGLKIAVVVHDTLPLDYPEYMRPDSVPKFRKSIAAVAHHADVVIHPTETSRRSADSHLAQLGRVPVGIHAPIGVDYVPADLHALPQKLRGLEKIFVSVGTLEPRKNHGLLLDLWEALATERAGFDMPHLVLAGARGWHPPSFFARLEASPLYGTYIHEAAGLSDAAIAALYEKSTALLFPSFAEGTGLPPIEAATHNCPIILGDLPVYKETLGRLPVYVSPMDMYSWLRIINKNLAGSLPDAPMPMFVAPDWQSHFDIVFPDG